MNSSSGSASSSPKTSPSGHTSRDARSSARAWAARLLFRCCWRVKSAMAFWSAMSISSVASKGVTEGRPPSSSLMAIYFHEIWLEIIT